MVESSDAGRVTAVRPGDPPERLRQFFDAAMGEVFPYLLRRCGHDRATAEDLTQETFVSAVRTLRSGHLDHLTIGWLVTCAQSRFIDHCRSAARRERHLTLVASSDVDSPDDEVGGRVVGDAAVAELLGDLPASQRMVVALHYLDGLSAPEIAERTDRSVRAVESLLARARRTMRQRMTEVADGE